MISPAHEAVVGAPSLWSPARTKDADSNIDFKPVFGAAAPGVERLL
jgi:hypothetical protein